MSQTRIEQRMLRIIDALEDLRAEMILTNMIPEAESLLTLVNDLIWQHRDITDRYNNEQRRDSS